MRKVLTLDIETLTPEPQVELVQLPPVPEGTPPAWAAWWTAVARDLMQPKPSFPPLTEHRPCCIRWLYAYDHPTAGFRSKWDGGIVESAGDEAVILEALIRDMNSADNVITFNGAAFDLPLIRMRAHILGLDTRGMRGLFMRYPERGHELTAHIDLADYLSNYGRATRFSLDKTARAFGLPSPKQVHCGSDVVDLWKSKDFSAIVRYCDGDVYATWLIGLKVLRSYRLCVDPYWTTLSTPAEPIADAETLPESPKG